jgi:mercuric ion transport protein
MAVHEQTGSAASDVLASEVVGTARESEKALLSIGGALAGIGATSCCVIPFTLVSLGAGGAWLSNLTALAPYQPYFLAAAFVLLGLGFWRVYRKRKVACTEGSYCAKPASDRIAKIGLWTGAVLVVAAVAFNTVVPWFLNS